MRCCVRNLSELSHDVDVVGADEIVQMIVLCYPGAIWFVLCVNEFWLCVMCAVEMGGVFVCVLEV